MKNALMGILFATTLFCSATARADPVREFFRWVNAVVVESILDKEKNLVVIKVRRDDWDTGGRVFQDRLGFQILCTKFANESEATNKGLDARVMYADQDQDLGMRWSVPGADRICDWVLIEIEEQIKQRSPGGSKY